MRTRSLPARACFGLILLAFHIFAASAVRAQGAGAILLEFNTSARHAALGSAGVGMPWGADTDHWANPALLAFRPGIQYLDFHSALATGFADDIFVDNNEFTVGAWGVTLLWAKGPADGAYLDLGTLYPVDENQMSLGPIHSYMAAESRGLGVDLARLAGRILHRDLARRVSVAVGWTQRDYSERLAPDGIVQGGTSSSFEGSVEDRGLALRVTPLVFDAPDGLRGNGFFGLEVGLGYGVSRLAHDDGSMERFDGGRSDPWPRAYLDGWSLHAALPQAPVYRDRPRRGFGAVLAAATDPHLAVTYTSQTIRPGYSWTGSEYAYIRNDDDLYAEKGHGWEITVLNILSIRRGHTTFARGEIDGSTAGWGLNLQWGRQGGFRYDEARLPQATMLPPAYRRGWSVWVDPLALLGRD